MLSHKAVTYGLFYTEMFAFLHLFIYLYGEKGRGGREGEGEGEERGRGREGERESRRVEDRERGTEEAVFCNSQDPLAYADWFIMTLDLICGQMTLIR